MNLGLGEVGEPPDMVGVEMRYHDVANIVSAKTKPLDLPHGGFIAVVMPA